MPEDLQRKRLFKEIKSSLQRRQLDRALDIARDYHNAYKQFNNNEQLLLYVAFSATNRHSGQHDTEEKMIAHLLWQAATSQMTSLQEVEAANHGIWLAEIHLRRREICLAWSALMAVKPFVTHGPVFIRYSKAVDTYESRSGRSDSNLRME